MEKQTLLVFGVIAILVIGILLIGGRNREKGSEGTLIDSGSPTKCILETMTETLGIEAKKTFTVYIANDKARFDIKTEELEDGEVYESHIIFNEEWIYSWNNIAQTKIKLSKKEAKSNQRLYAVPYLTEKGYKCEVWTSVDNLKFIPPADIDFREIKK